MAHKKIALLNLTEQDRMELSTAKRHLLDGNREFASSLMVIRRGNPVPGEFIDVGSPEVYMRRRVWPLFLGTEDLPAKFEQPFFEFHGHFVQALRVIYSVAERNLAHGTGKNTAQAEGVAEDFLIALEKDGSLSLSEFLRQRNLQISDHDKIDIAELLFKTQGRIVNNIMRKAGNRIRVALDIAAIEGRYPDEYYEIRKIEEDGNRREI